MALRHSRSWPDRQKIKRALFSRKQIVGILKHFMLEMRCKDCLQILATNDCRTTLPVVKQSFEKLAARQARRPGTCAFVLAVRGMRRAFCKWRRSLAGISDSVSVRRWQLEAERPSRRSGGGRAGFWGGHFFHGHCVVGAQKNCACKAKNTRPVGGQRPKTYW